MPRLRRKVPRRPGDQRRPSAPPSPTCTTPATQNEGGCDQVPRLATRNEGGCHQVPRLPRKVPRRHRRPKPAQARHQVQLVPPLPRKTKVDVAKCHACHAKRRWMSPSATPATQSAAAARATNGDQACHQVQLVPLLPGQTQVDVAKCHACFVKRRWMSPSATPATQSAAAPRATNGDQARHQVQLVPRLPRKTKVDVTKCHACHAKRRWMSPSATPATQSAAALRATNGDQARHQVQLVPRLPRKTKVDVAKCHACHVKTKVDVTKCHACHAKCRSAPGNQRRPSAPPSATCTTPATQNEGRCRQVPRLPRETKGGCHQVPRLPRKVPQRPGQPTATTRHQVQLVPRLPRKTKVDVSKCHACYVKPRWMSPSATPATQSAAAPRATNGDQARHQVQLVPRLPRKTKVDVAKGHACHAKRRWMSPSATLATQSAAAPRRHACHAKCRGAPGDQRRPSAQPSTTFPTLATQNEGV